MIVERIENWRNRFDGPAWKVAFEALAALGPDSPEGETRLQGDDIFMRVMSYATRTPEEAVLETHREYIDIQMALAGSEGLEWHPAAGLPVKTPYDPQRDAAFYHRPGPGPARVNVTPGTFVVLWPEDAHMPQLIVGDSPATVKKVVVKLRAALVHPMG